MLYYIFRNSTIEPLFRNLDVRYSGYDDISSVDQEADCYIWFYQVPFRFDPISVEKEVSSYIDKLRWIYEKIPDHRNLLVFSLVDLYPFKWIESEWDVQVSIEKYNEALRALALEKRNVKYIELSDFTRHYPFEQLLDWRFYFISQMGINPKLAPVFSEWFGNKLRGINLQRKKCLILDLDNTLWGGVLGEDGINGIQIGGDYPGKAFLYFQEGLLELAKRGVILTVCSKNNEQDVLDVWNKNPFILLRQKHFSAWRINWQNKADNIREVAEELNIGLDSCVFVDDNPTERELVRQMLPMVEVPDFPKQPYLLPDFLISLSNRYFQIYSITEEDRLKTEQYKANTSRMQERKRFVDLEQYLRNLEIEMRIELMGPFNLSRISQMTQKTNQFNLTTRRYSESDLTRFASEGWSIYCLSVKDRFGDNGITGAILLRPIKGGYEIDSFLLSCRILGKKIEEAFLFAVLNRLKGKGNRVVKASYVPTTKNIQVSGFYDQAHFVLDSQDEKGNKFYHLEMGAELEIPSYYKIMYQDYGR